MDEKKPLPPAQQAHLFKPGQSGNPGGRPKLWNALSRQILERTEGGKLLLDFALRVVKGEKCKGQTPTLKDRLEALKWLGDRGWGKPVASVDLKVKGTVATAALAPEHLAALSDDELDSLEALAGKLSRAAQGDADTGGDPGGEGEASEG